MLRGFHLKDGPFGRPSLPICQSVSPFISPGFCESLECSAPPLFCFDSVTWAGCRALHLDDDWWCLLNYGEAQIWRMAGPLCRKTPAEPEMSLPSLPWLHQVVKWNSPRRVWKAMFNSIFRQPLSISHICIQALGQASPWQLSTLNLLTRWLVEHHIKLHYMTLLLMLLSKATYNKCIQPWRHNPKKKKKKTQQESFKYIKFITQAKCFKCYILEIRGSFFSFSSFLGLDTIWAGESSVCEGKCVWFLLLWCQQGARSTIVKPGQQIVGILSDSWASLRGKE